MDQLEFKHESNNNFYQEMDKFSDERFKENNYEAPNSSKQQTVYKEDLTNPNNKNNNSTVDSTPFTNNLVTNTDSNSNSNTNNILKDFRISHIPSLTLLCQVQAFHAQIHII